MAQAKAAMNKTALYVGGGIVLLLLIVGAAMAMRRGVNPVTNPVSILTGGTSMKCEYTEAGRNIVAYIKGENFRTDITGGTEGNMNTIHKGDTTWTWSNETKKGTKFVFTPPSITPSASGTDTTSTPENTDKNAKDMQDQINKYKESCKNQGVDDTLFTPPSYVQFQDYSSMMQQVQQNTGTGNPNYQQMMEKYKQYMPQQ